MNKNRPQEKIIADILSVVKKNQKKTRIMYGANLSYELLCKYIDKLIVAELIKYRKNDKIYELTNKGEEYLNNYAEYESLRNQLEANKQLLNEKQTVLTNIISRL